MSWVRRQPISPTLMCSCWPPTRFKRIGGFSIDVSIRQTSADSHGASSSTQAATQPLDPALASIPIIRSFLASQPALRHLALVIKLFLSTYVDKDSGKDGLGSAATGGIGSYVLVCMCIAYLSHIDLLDMGNVRLYPLFK